MPDFSITDSLGNPIDSSAVNWTSPQSLGNYVKSEILHLAVLPDYVQIKDKPLTQAIPKPTSFKLSVQPGFQLGMTNPEVDVEPGADVELIANATSGSNLFDGDPFRVAVEVPQQTAYVGISMEGLLDLGVCGTSGDLTFGIGSHQSISFEFMKAFPTNANEPTFWNATAAMFSNFVIPRDIEDLKRLNSNDLCCVSGLGSLKICGSISISTPVNPLASVNLPLRVGTLEVQDGLLAGLSTLLTLSGSYEIRVQKMSGDAIRLSYLRTNGTALQTDVTASAGISVDVGNTDLLAKLLGVLGKGALDPKTLTGLTPDEIKTFTTTLKTAIDHSLQVSMDADLSQSNENAIAFQYDLQPSRLDEASTEAVNCALKGDLSLLTALEDRAEADGTIAAGVKLLNSLFSTVKTNGISLKVNLLGIVNLISSSNLINNCEFLFDPASGDLTIKETAGSDRISAIAEPDKKQEALCKAIFDSVLVTTTYVVSRAIAIPSLSCEAAHFASNRNTNRQTIADYTNWFAVLNLLTPAERDAILEKTSKSGASSCVVRAPFDNAACEALFLDSQGNLRPELQYLEIGRQALKGLLDPGDTPVDQFRYDILNNNATWQKALAKGPNSNLAEIIPLSSADSRFLLVLHDVMGDVYNITWWADSMQKAGQALSDMRKFLANRDPTALANDPDFANRCAALQKVMLGVVGASQLRFNEPLGIICLYAAAGSRRSSGKITSAALTLDKQQAAAAASRA